MNNNDSSFSSFHTPSFSVPFFQELMSIARQLSRIHRNTDEPLPLVSSQERFLEELEELHEADEVWDELPDITYFAGLCCIHGGGKHEMQVLLLEAERCGATLPQLERACIAKFAMRAANGAKKDKAAERVVILAAVAAVTSG